MNNKYKWLMLFALCFSFQPLFAGQLAGVTLPDSETVSGTPLVMNGIGLREVTKWGFTVKVYVAGLYLKTKNKNSTEVIASQDPKKLVMHFVRNVDRQDLFNAFLSGYKDNCVKDCAKASEQFKPFGASVVSVRSGNKIQFTFNKDQVTFEVDGPNKVSKTFTDAALSQNLLALFINEKNPPTKELRKGLMGL